MTPREAAISVAERIERVLKEREKTYEERAKSYALEAVIKTDETAANDAKVAYATAQFYEEALKIVNEQLRLELVEIGKQSS